MGFVCLQVSLKTAYLLYEQYIEASGPDRILSFSHFTSDFCAKGRGRDKARLSRDKNLCLQRWMGWEVKAFKLPMWETATPIAATHSPHEMALTFKSPEHFIAEGFVQQPDLCQRLLFFQQQAHNPLTKKSSCSSYQAAYPSQGHCSGLLLSGELTVSLAWFSSCLRE